MKKSNTGENVFATKAGKRELEEREKRQAAVSKRIDAFSAVLDDLARTSASHSLGKAAATILKVKVLKGKEFPLLDLAHGCSLLRLSFGDQIKHTTAKKATLSPLWNETFSFRIREPPPRYMIVRHYCITGDDEKKSEIMELMDDDDLRGMAEVPINLTNLSSEKSLNAWHKLRPSASRRGDSDKWGEISLELKLATPTDMFAASRSTSHKSLESGKSAISAPRPAAQLSLIECINSSEQVQQIGNDTKRMLLVGHLSRLRSPSSELRKSAIQTLANRAGRNGQDLPKTGDWLKTLLNSFSDRVAKDPDVDVRLEAVQGLVMICRQGNPEAVKVMALAMRDQSRDVRQAAVGAMLQLAANGDDIAIAAVAECLEDGDHKVRTFAGQVLPKLSSIFDQRLLKEVIKRTENIHAVVRTNAVNVLVTLTNPGAPVVVETLLHKLSDIDAEVRIAALNGLVSQVPRGEEKIIKLVLTQLDHHSHEVRAACAQCLQAIAGEGDRGVIAALCNCMDDAAKDLYGHYTVRPVALKALGSLASKSSGRLSARTYNRTLSVALKQLEEDDWSIRKAAVQVLLQVANCREEPILGKLVSMLDDKHQQVRVEAGAVLASLFDQHDKWLNVVLSLKLILPDPNIRSTAAMLLQNRLKQQRISQRAEDLLNDVRHGKVATQTALLDFLLDTGHHSDPQAIEGLFYCLDHRNDEVRETAHVGLETLAAHGDPNIVSHLVTRLNDPDWKIRRDAILTLSRFANKGDETVVSAIIARLDDDQREVVAAVGEAASKLLTPGDRRIMIVNACVRLDPKYNSKEERTIALQELGRAAYAAIHLTLQGTCVEDADLEGFWNLINSQATNENDSWRSGSNEDLLQRILKRLEDDEWWVRRAAVEAARECTKEWDKTIADALEGMLYDKSLAVRNATIKALEGLCYSGDRAVIDLLVEKLDDNSRIVRLSAVQALKRFVKTGDRKTARLLMTWLRFAWKYVRSRGNDTEVKVAIAHLILDVLLFRDAKHSNPFLVGLQNTKLHQQRNAISRFEDYLTQQGLIEPFKWQQYDQEHAMDMDNHQGYGEQHWKAAKLIQRITRKKRHDTNQYVEKWWQKFKKNHAPDMSKSLASIKDFMKKEDAIAQKIISLQVPMNIRSAAISTAFEKSMKREEDMLPWERMRWTEKLRLCEEVAGRTWVAPTILDEEFGV